LHLGHARSFLLAWWHARSRGGRIVLRLEDLDRTRVKPGMAEACVRDLEWLGLDWDGAVELQSDHEDELRARLAELDALGLVYACVCTRKEIRAAASAPHADEGEGEGRYPGTCRDRFASLEAAERESGRGAALRFRAPEGEVRFTDSFAGEMRFEPAREVGDFPLTSRDGQLAYQLAVVADDARQGVSEVVRGADLLASTSQQILLQRALGLPHPLWFHVPLVVDATGRRLAKRADDLSLERLREEDVDPRAIVQWVARASGVDVRERVTAAELVDAFVMGRVPRAPVAVVAQILDELRR
jgi:glutamyl-tRNA synthetase